MFSLKHSASRKLITFLLVLSFVAPNVFFVKPEKVHAGFPVSVLADLPQTIKEFALDTLGWVIAKQILRAITQSVIAWINSGFKGDPLFISNPESFFSDVLDQVTGEFLLYAGLENICQPFRPFVAINVGTDSYYKQKIECTLDKFVDNVDAFVEDFEQGGWSGWFGMTMNAQNNPYGAYLVSADEQSRRAWNFFTNSKDDVKQGGGFLSMRECAEPEDYSPNSKDKKKTVCTRWISTTPGAVIAEKLNINLGTGEQQLLMADEISESVAAIFNALINKLVSDGLSSLAGGSRRGGGGSRIDPRDLFAEQDEEEKGNLLEEIDQALLEEEKILRAGDRATHAKDLVNKLRSCYLTHVTHYKRVGPFRVEIRPSSSFIVDEDEAKERRKDLRFETRVIRELVNRIDENAAAIRVRSFNVLRDKVVALNLEEANTEGNSVSGQQIADLWREFADIKGDSERGQALGRLDELETNIRLFEQELRECNASLRGIGYTPGNNAQDPLTPFWTASTSVTVVDRASSGGPSYFLGCLNGYASSTERDPSSTSCEDEGGVGANQVWSERIPFGSAVNGEDLSFALSPTGTGEAGVYTLAISDLPWDMDPLDPRCKVVGTSTSVSIRAIDEGAQDDQEGIDYASRCPIARNSLFYLNIKPNAPYCSSGQCRFSTLAPTTSFYISLDYFK